ncbi:MAG: two-component system, OmpR family, sensor kinase [Thermoleophilaceae bacterium]|nr:two-component system, OmpR family, sensor kinase [Thermoleophilaceae bacterium]
MIAVALSGWLLAFASVARTRGRDERLARAEHELRGPLTALSLAAAAWSRDPARRGAAEVLDAQLARAGAGLDELRAARRGGVAPRRTEPIALESLSRSAMAGWRLAAAREGRTVEVDWRAGAVTVRADRGRVAQALGNVIANAVEHGRGPVRLSARRTATGVRLEVENERGRGIPIAAAAAEQAGGRLTVATLDLPVEA